MKRFMTCLILLSSALALDITSLSAKTIECYCTDTLGARVELGEVTCLTVGGRIFLARCEMSLNVPIWRDTDQSCVSS